MKFICAACYAFGFVAPLAIRACVLVIAPTFRSGSETPGSALAVAAGMFVLCFALFAELAIDSDPKCAVCYRPLRSLCMGVVAAIVHGAPYVLMAYGVLFTPTGLSLNFAAGLFVVWFCGVYVGFWLLAGTSERT